MATKKKSITGERYYVYALVDPRDGAQFYIGKGSGSRIHQHVRNVRNGRETNQAKAARIREILAAGLEVSHEILFRTESETEAYDFESRAIASGVSLTNAMPGYQTQEQKAQAMKLWASSMLDRMVAFENWAHRHFPGARQFYNRCAMELRKIKADPRRFGACEAALVERNGRTVLELRL